MFYTQIWRPCGPEYVTQLQSEWSVWSTLCTQTQCLYTLLMNRSQRTHRCRNLRCTVRTWRGMCAGTSRMEQWGQGASDSCTVAMWLSSLVIELSAKFRE